MLKACVRCVLQWDTLAVLSESLGSLSAALPNSLRSCVVVVWPGLFWVVDQAWPLFYRWRQSVWSSVAHPPAAIHPLHRCAGCSEPLQSQQSFARDSHPTGGTITRGFQNCLEEFNPNKITIHISFFGSTEQGASMLDISLFFLLFKLL